MIFTDQRKTKKKETIKISSTNRSNARNSHVADYYVTPHKPILQFLNEFSKVVPDFLNGTILDPCAGGDIIHPMSYPEVIKNYQLGFDKNIKTMDIRNDSLASIKADYITYQLNYEPKLIITNPPFAIAQNIIEKALIDVQDDGWVIMLLRLNYFGGDVRANLWNKYMPEYAFVHRKRMSFTENGGTDSVEYMHCCWHKGYNPEFTKLKVI